MRVVLVAALMLLMGSCLGTASGGAPKLPSLPTLAQAAGQEEMGPALGMADESGRLIDSQAVQGRVVLVDFWASWCGPCQHSIPFYRRLYERFQRKGLVVVGVNVDDDHDDMREYLAVHPLPFSIIWDKEKALSGRFGVMQLPTAFLFDRKGRLRKTRLGFDPEEMREVEDEVRLLLGEDG
ncbi:MAG: TlpA disulfide reductase family protein [Myxococcota bacterium]